MRRFHVLSCALTLVFLSSYSYAGIPWIFSWFIATTHSNCSKGVTANNAEFCAVFKSVAQCHCTSSGLPLSMCKDMGKLYQRMLSIFRSQKNACEYQKDTTTKNCMDDWNCYRLGGRDSYGELCNSTGQHC